MRTIRKKRKGFGLKMVTLQGEDGVEYLFFKTPQGGYHAFQEIPTKNGLRKCGGKEGNTRQMAKKLLGF
jgi:hypothetical protein